MKNPDAVRLGRLGGLAWQGSRTLAERQAAGRHAARMRWGRLTLAERQEATRAMRAARRRACAARKRDTPPDSAG